MFSICEGGDDCTHTPYTSTTNVITQDQDKKFRKELDDLNFISFPLHKRKEILGEVVYLSDPKFGTSTWDWLATVSPSGILDFAKVFSTHLVPGNWRDIKRH
jgi:hypothetical protein